jgi:hypothetical protein
MDHDLRYDPNVPEVPHAQRSPKERLLEAAQRGRDGDEHAPDVRIFDQVVISELVRLVDTIQTLSLRQDVFEEELGARRDAIDARLSRLESSLKRIADAVQVLILRLDDGK